MKKIIFNILFFIPLLYGQMLTAGCVELCSEAWWSKATLADLKIYTNDQDVINKKDPYGFSPLHFAVSNNSPKKVEFLLRKGAKVNAKSHYGFTPIFHAVGQSGDLKIVNLLLEAGANVNAAGSSRITPLHDAAKFASVKIAIALLRAGAAINVHDFAGHSPLHYAVACHNRHVRAALLRAGADITRLSYTTDPYIRRVRAAGGFRAYMRVHRDQLMLNFAPKFPRLPPQMVRRILVFWLHAGCY